ncbi:MAG: RNA polymerase sigma factor [Candidatus Paceibacterota bacterium]|jgi:RNA polymerase sigma-70 factor (ECF subfamily)
MDKTDKELILLAKDGDSQAFGFLIDRYEDKISRYARKFLSNTHDIQDIVQEVFIKAYINIQSFNEEESFSPWVYRIAHNEFINALKKKKREPLSFFDADTLFPHPVSLQNADDSLNERESKEMVDKFLDQVSVKYKEPLVLYYFENLSYQEISQILKIPISTVGVRLQRAKKMIKKIYERE